MKKKIFVVDDEKDIQDIIKINLQNEGYNVLSFFSAEDALRAIPKEAPDLIVLDIMMEGMDGFEFCKKLRADNNFKAIPIIFLSVKSNELDKILGLELGGDDYMTKPFSVKELVSRIKAVLRRSEASGKLTDGAGAIKYQGIVIHPDKYQALLDGREIKLTKTEFELLLVFLKHPGKIFTRDNIIDSIRGSDIYITDRTVDVHVMNLRKKLEKYKNLISTFSGVGYGIK
ncbi:MAG: response regulator [Spirochaetes bacterium]|jgi:DNA-binding response OmpR family regulator|nr:response regulator [Spirochaetota bacterium]